MSETTTTTAPETTQAGNQSQTPVETFDQVQEGAFKALEAYQANPNDELKASATAAWTKARESYAADKKAREEAAAKNRPPEKYDLKLPDGSKLDAKALEGISAFAKANGLSQEAAKAMLERENANLAASVEAQKAAQLKAIEDEKAAWVKSFEEDKEIGGANAKASAETSKRVLGKIMADRPDFLKDLEDTGIGNHPEFIRLLTRIGKLTGDDKLVPAQTKVANDQDIAAKMYPKS